MMTFRHLILLLLPTFFILLSIFAFIHSYFAENKNGRFKYRANHFFQPPDNNLDESLINILKFSHLNYIDITQFDKESGIKIMSFLI